MEELKYFPTWMLLLIPQVIAVLKQWVPALWREILAAVIAAVATAYVIVTTDLTWVAGLQEGFILFAILAGTRAAVTGAVNSFKATKKEVPILASKETVKNLSTGLGLLLLAFWVGSSWAQDSLVVEPIKETAKETAKIWILLGAQILSRLLDGWFNRKK